MLLFTHGFLLIEPLAKLSPKYLGYEAFPSFFAFSLSDWLLLLSVLRRGRCIAKHGPNLCGLGVEGVCVLISLLSRFSVPQL